MCEKNMKSLLKVRFSWRAITYVRRALSIKKYTIVDRCMFPETISSDRNVYMRYHSTRPITVPETFNSRSAINSQTTWTFGSGSAAKCIVQCRSYEICGIKFIDADLLRAEKSRKQLMPLLNRLVVNGKIIDYALNILCNQISH